MADKKDAPPVTKSDKPEEDLWEIMLSREKAADDSKDSTNGESPVTEDSLLVSTSIDNGQPPDGKGAVVKTETSVFSPPKKTRKKRQAMKKEAKASPPTESVDEPTLADFDSDATDATQNLKKKMQHRAGIVPPPKRHKGDKKTQPHIKQHVDQQTEIPSASTDDITFQTTGVEEGNTLTPPEPEQPAPPQPALAQEDMSPVHETQHGFNLPNPDAGDESHEGHQGFRMPDLGANPTAQQLPYGMTFMNPTLPDGTRGDPIVGTLGDPNNGDNIPKIRTDHGHITHEAVEYFKRHTEIFAAEVPDVIERRAKVPLETKALIIANGYSNPNAFLRFAKDKNPDLKITQYSHADAVEKMLIALRDVNRLMIKHMGRGKFATHAWLDINKSKAISAIRSIADAKFEYEKMDIFKAGMTKGNKASNFVAKFAALTFLEEQRSNPEFMSPVADQLQLTEIPKVLEDYTKLDTVPNPDFLVREILKEIAEFTRDELQDVGTSREAHKMLVKEIKSMQSTWQQAATAAYKTRGGNAPRRNNNTTPANNAFSNRKGQEGNNQNRNQQQRNNRGQFNQGGNQRVIRNKGKGRGNLRKGQPQRRFPNQKFNRANNFRKGQPQQRKGGYNGGKGGQSWNRKGGSNFGQRAGNAPGGKGGLIKDKIQAANRHLDKSQIAQQWCEAEKIGRTCNFKGCQYMHKWKKKGDEPTPSSSSSSST